MPVVLEDLATLALNKVRTYDSACGHPVNQTETAIAGTAVKTKPAAKRRFRQARNSSPIGMAIWGLNKAIPMRPPAVNSASRSKARAAKHRRARNKIESCP